MSQRLRHPLFGYVVAIASVALAFLFRVSTAPVLGERAPFFPFGLAVLFAAWSGGLLPGFLATVLGSVGGVYFFLMPLRGPGGLEPGDVLSILVFVVFSLVTSVLFEQVRRYRDRASRDAERMDHIQDAIFSWERRGGRVLSWNKGAAGLYGIPAEEAIGRSVHQLLRTVHANGLHAVYAELEEAGEWSGELVHTARSGQPVPVSTRLVMLEQPRQRLVVLQVDRDISDRKHREANEAEARRLRGAVYELIERLQHAHFASDVYGAALAAIRDALRCSRASILLFDGAGRMRFVASAGLSEEYRRAVDGHSPWAPDAQYPEPLVIPDVEGSEMDGGLRRVIRDEGIGALAFVPLVAEDRLIGKFMAYFDAPHEFSPEEIDAALAIGRELAFGLHRARSEERLRGSEERLTRETGELARLNEATMRLWRAAALDEGLGGILGSAMELLRADKGTLQLWSVERGALRIAAQRGFDEPFIDHFSNVHERTAAVCGRALEADDRVVIQDVETEEGLSDIVEIYRAADVRSVQSTPLRRRDGSLLGVLSTHWRVPHRPEGQDLRRLDLFLRTATDFLERWAADEDLRREVGERQRAEDALRRNVAELRKATAALEENDRRKNEFLATLGHELRNPLAPMMTGLELLRRLGLSMDAETVRAMMERQVGAMARLVDDLLDLNRINTGRLRLQRETTPLATVLRRAVETSAPLIEERAHRLVLALPDGAVAVDADVTRLSQVFVALLNNAAQYTDPGGVIRLTAASGPDGTATVTVSDTGRGIAASELTGIFEIFTRASSSTPSGQAGLGIGLSLARSLVAMHGGTIEAESGGPGRGSQFTVRLPTAVARQAPAPAPEARTPTAAGLRVLVVDDNRDAASSLARLLETMGSVVRTAFDGEQAAVIAHEFQPDVALLDIGMPTIDGYEAARRIRRQSNGRRIRLVALTGYGQESDRRRSADAGFDRHLVKPLRPQTLLDLLAEFEKSNPVSPAPSTGETL